MRPFVPSVTNLDKWLHTPGARARTEGVILHSTAGSSLAGALSALRQRGLAYNFLIDKDGSIHKCLPIKAKASHAGVSVGWSGPNCNSYTIGIAFVNENDGVKHITPEQEQAVRWLLKTQLKPEYPSLKYLTTHYGVSYPRKSDPRTVNARSIAEDSELIYWPGRRRD